MCKSHIMWGGLLLLVVGILFLLRDFGVWDFWNIQGWSILYILIGCKMMHWAKYGKPMAAAPAKKKRK